MTVRTNSPTKVPSVLTIPAGVSPELRRYLEQLTETIEIRLGRRGDQRDRAVTLRELIDSGLAKDLLSTPFDPNTSGNTGFVQPGQALQDLAEPPAPTGFTAVGTFSQVVLNWDYPTYANHSFTEVWRHDADSIGDAQLIGVQAGRIFVDPVGSGATRYYWARHVNTDSVAGPFNSASGTSATTATDVQHMLTLLSGAITSSELATSLSGPIGNLPADTQAAIDLKKANIPTFSMTSFALGDIVKESGSGTKLYIAIQAVPSSGKALTNTNFWKLYGDYNSLKTATDTAASDITDINTISSTSNSAAAVKLAAVDAILFDSDGNEIVSATNLSTMSSTVLDSDGNARASASQIDQLSASYTNPETGAANNVTLQQALETSASEVDGLRGQYTVKLDTNGAAAGFGLASTSDDAGNITSEFIVNADRFAIIGSGTTLTNPTGSHNASVPFTVITSQQTINGETVPPGVYMTDAFIKNGSIVSAKIGTLSADKLTAGTISADRIGTNSINASKLVLDNASIVSQTINGVPTVVVQDLSVGILTGSLIRADKIMVDNATIDTDSSNRLIIKDLGVDTLQIAGNACTVPTSAYTATSVSLTNSQGEVTVQTISYTASGVPVLLTGAFVALPNSGRSHQVRAQIKQTFSNGTSEVVLTQEKAGSGSGTGNHYFNLTVTHTPVTAVGSTTPATGTVTYILTYENLGATAQAAAIGSAVSDRHLSGIEVKK